MTPGQRSKMMASIRGKHTKPEIAVRAYLHRLGLRYALHARDLPGCPDIVLRPIHAVIFVHGCFWHQCPHCHVAEKKIRSNLDYWQPKFERNKMRDACARQALITNGWHVFVVWECQVR